MYNDNIQFAEDGDAALRKSYKQTAQREQPVSFCNMSEILGKFESGDVTSKDRTNERKEEIRNIRNRMFMVIFWFKKYLYFCINLCWLWKKLQGKQSALKKMYQQSVQQSEQSEA